MVPTPLSRAPRIPTAAAVDVRDANGARHVLQLGNVSTTGVFIKDLVWLRPGDRVVLRIAALELETKARAVHILSAAANRTPGAGMAFENVDDPTRVQLARFLATLVPANAPLLAVPKGAGLELTVSMEQLSELWTAQLSRRWLLVQTTASPAMRTSLPLTLVAPHGAHTLEVEAVYRGEGTLGLEVVRGNAALEHFVRGQRPSVATSTVTTLPPNEVFTRARVLLASAEAGVLDLGLPQSASIDQQLARAEAFVALFTQGTPGLSPPQQARLAVALKVVTRERDRLARAARSVLELRAARPEPAAPVEPAPRAHSTKQELIELIEQAEVFVTTGMTTDAIANIKRAAPRTADPTLLLRCLQVCMRCGDSARALAIAQHLTDRDRNHVEAWRWAMRIYQSTGRMALAQRAARKLLKVAPGDLEARQVENQ